MKYPMTWQPSDYLNKVSSIITFPPYNGMFYIHEVRSAAGLHYLAHFAVMRKEKAGRELLRVPLII